MRPRSAHLWKPALLPALQVAEAAQSRVDPEQWVRRRETVFRRPSRGGTDRIRRSVASVKRIPFANILQLFRSEFMTFGSGGFILHKLSRMRRYPPMEEYYERKSSRSNAGRGQRS